MRFPAPAFIGPYDILVSRCSFERQIVLLNWGIFKLSYFKEEYRSEYVKETDLFSLHIFSPCYVKKVFRKLAT